MKSMTKITYILSILLAFEILAPNLAWSQESPLVVTSNFQSYEQEIARKPYLKLVNINQFASNLEVDLRYASKNNFTGIRLYPKHLNSSFLILKAAEALGLVSKELHELGYGIKIFDAYRPYSVTQKFWELIQDERYVANPAKGSGHNRGTAIDLTLYSLKTKSELNMGTGFDNFSDTAHHSFKNLSAEVLANRKLLKEMMEKHGFKSLETEWWHYSLENSSNYPVLNILFQKLK